MTTLIILAGIGLLAIGVILYMKKNKEETVPQETPKAKTPTHDIEKAKEELLASNIFIRENISSKELITSFEEAIDLVQDVLEPANDPDKFSDQTIMVNRMSTDYIPRLINGYMALQNDEAEKTTLHLLGKTKELLVAIKDSYEKDNKEGFNRNSRVMDAIFESNTFKTKGEDQ